MNIICDSRIPQNALDRLSEFGNLILFSTRDVTYKAISGHTDIFFCNMGGQLIAAPNLPEAFTEKLKVHEIHFVKGEILVGNKYPESAGYNAVVTDHFLIHNFRYTDPVITDHAADRELIHVNQGYTRCSLLPLKNDCFITSDEGIFRTLKGLKKEVLFVKPDDIVLPGKKHGFFGGACGIHENKVFITGSLKWFGEGEKCREYLVKLNYEIVELYDGSLFDGGSILFL
jgi:hypothetical protein